MKYIIPEIPPSNNKYIKRKYDKEKSRTEIEVEEV